MSILMKTSPGQINEYYGLSTDEKPMDDNVPNGSTFYEMDTVLLYMFDADSKRWLLQ